MYEIRNPESLTPLGVCGLTSIDLYNRHAEFSLYIAPQLQGDGLGTRALKTLLAYGFKTLGLNSIWGETFQGNHALKMFEQMGFKIEGSRRDFYFRDGKYIDAVLVSMQASEFK
jgi:RimJ/RimL family protein N-acetyltransferase